MPTVVASDIYPAVRNFLLECGLQKALKAFDKETASEDEPAVAGKKAKILADLELIAACQTWLDARLEAKGKASSVGDEAPASPKVNGLDQPKDKKKKKARKESAAEEVPQAAEEVVEARPAKKRKASELAAAQPAEAAAAEEGEPPASKKDKKKDKKEKAERKPGVPFQRIDSEKWVKTIRDARLMDNTHEAKDKFGTSAGDSWGDKAAVDLIQVKGKGFRKEMAKKKRSSWRGGGEIDQGVNSIKFEASSDEEE